MDEDDVDGVARRVVEVTRDTSSLLGGGKAPFALRLALGLSRPLLQVGDALAPQADTISEDPGSAPDQRSEQGWDDRRLVASEAGGADVNEEQGGDDDGGEPALVSGGKVAS